MYAFVTIIDGIEYYRSTDDPKKEYKLVDGKYVLIKKKIKELVADGNNL